MSSLMGTRDLRVRKQKLLIHKSCFPSERNVSYQPVQFVKIYLATATYDEIEKDEKVTTEAALGLIGGTMGLFTGFSILSGVEIIYYLAKFFMSLRVNITDYQKNSKSHLQE